MNNKASMFAGITSGLMGTYSLLANASSGKVTLDSIASARSNSSLNSSLNPTFASYIQSNFSMLDKDKDGVLGSVELSDLTNSINSNGVTAAQLSQLGTASGLSSQELSQVLSHFSEIDKNGDGKITSAEIQSYKLQSAKNKKMTEFANRAAANQSLFYGNEETSSVPDSSTILAYKYWNDGSN